MSLFQDTRASQISSTKMFRMNGDLTDERGKLEELVEKYPDTEAAADAGARIKEIDSQLRRSGQADAWGG